MCSEGDVRLNGGIVEVCTSGHYGYICATPNTHGGPNSRAVLGRITCEQLGFDPFGNLLVM